MRLQILNEAREGLRRRRFSGFTGLALLCALAIVFGFGSTVRAQVTSGPVDGEIEFLFLDDPTDPFSSGSIVLSGQTIVIPRNLLIDLPANRLTLWQLFDQAPPDCLALGESGLAASDGCVRGKGGGYGHVLANQMPDSTLVAGDLFIQKGNEVLTGVITFIDHTDGYLRCNGDPTDAANTGMIVRINDPDGVNTIQQGLGCTGGPNCSPDPRFTTDSANYTITFSTGYPACIPSTVLTGNRTTPANPDGTGDPFCPDSNRGSLVAANSVFMAPMQVGDHFSCQGNTEVILDRITGQEVSFLSSHTFSVSRALFTLPSPDQPDYVIFDEVEWDAPGFSNDRSRGLFIGFSSTPVAEVDVFALDKDPATGEDIERIMGSTFNNPLFQNQGIGATAGGIWKINYDVDFLIGAPVNPRRSPCTVLQNAGFVVCPGGKTLEEEFALISPLTREIIGRSRHKSMLNPGVESFDIQGMTSQNGEYLTPIGVGHPEFDEINLNAMDTPFIFTGENWNLDRRLGPGGCFDDICEDTTAVPMGSLRLDPFPYSALDAIGQIAAFTPLNISRIFAHYPFGPGDSLEFVANGLTLANAGATFGFLRGPEVIIDCSTLNASPVALDDAVTTALDTPLVIASATLLANDSDADLDNLTITAVGSPTALGGSVADNGDGTFTYTPPAGTSGTDLFTYLVEDAHGGSASATVTVTITP